MYTVDQYRPIIKALGVSNDGHEQTALEFFRYERNHSPMGEIMREYFAAQPSPLE